MSERPRALLAVWFEVPLELDEEFNEWYDREHLPERGLVPGFLSARRFVTLGQRREYLALYDLEHVGVLQSPAYQRISGQHESAWTRRMRRKATRLVRAVYEQILPAPGPGIWVLGPHAPLGDPTGGAVLVDALDVPHEMHEHADDWCAANRAPAFLDRPGFRAARRFRALEGTPYILTLYELASLEGLPELAAEGETTRATAPLGPLASHQVVYRQIYP